MVLGMGATSWAVLGMLLCGSTATVLDLGNMLKLMTDRNPLDFLNYGNWCGLGGNGYPMDDIDSCCRQHDFCYDKASDSVCLDEKPHVAKYRWKYAAGKLHCNKGDYGCGLATCRCDAKFAACVQVYKASYDPRNKRARQPLLNLLSNVMVQWNANR
ncbi:acidic phospholipase A2-like [Uloborus diversus]|uniref:acidic phospholipase A2-like n=1 Tax=Uloborus diversus TaxID=327109 RepID=UPI0024090E6B|nr:acidic phospholipase A2-like [Uloborus diversus]